MTNTKVATLIALGAQMDARKGYGGQIKAAVEILGLFKAPATCAAYHWATLTISGMSEEARWVIL